jgi:hypothetical protein
MLTVTISPPEHWKEVRASKASPLRKVTLWTKAEGLLHRDQLSLRETVNPENAEVSLAVAF